MKKQIKTIGIVALLLGLVAFLLWSRNRDKVATQASISPNSPAEEAPVVGVTTVHHDPMQELMQTPIVFYGLVLDQDDKPIPAAKVSASVLDNTMKGSPLSTTSDASGRFTIQSRGISLHIEVSRLGYSRIDRGGKLKPSSQGFDFGADVGKGIHHSDPASPVVFQLHKHGNPVILERLVANPNLSRDGSPNAVRLSKTSKASLQIRCRTIEDNEIPNARFDWRCDVAVEGGGIQEVKDEQSIGAPEDGYASSAVIDMPKILDVAKWSSRVNKSFWLHFPDNTFGKISFEMHARGDHFAVIDGFRNPSPNDRNFESKLDVSK